MNQWATSIQWTIKSVRSPPPKSQNHRQLRNRYSSNGWSGALPRKSFQATWRGSTPMGVRWNREVPPRFQLRWILKISPIRPPLTSSRAFWIWGMLRCCMPTWTTFLFRFWASMIAAPFGQVVGQRLLDVDILAGIAGVDGHRHVPVVGAADQDGVDVLAVEELAVMLGRDGLGIRQLLRRVEVGVVDVADGRDPDPRHPGQRLHQRPATAAGAQAGH